MEPPPSSFASQNARPTGAVWPTARLTGSKEKSALRETKKTGISAGLLIFN
jgi:hypothetical protein